MYRSFLILTVAILASTVCTTEIFAAQQGSAWPGYPLEGGAWRGDGFYFSWIKILMSWLVFLGWVYTTDWVSRDCMSCKLNFQQWNAVVFGSFVAAFFLMWLIPYFWLGFIILLGAYVGPLSWYIVHRNAKVEPNKRVLTPDHIRYCVVIALNKIGAKVDVEKKQDFERGPPVILTSEGSDERTNKGNTILARQSPGFRDARQIIADGLTRHASVVMLDYTNKGVAVRHMVDGVWHNAQPVEREIGDPALASLKVLCGLDPKDRQASQQGEFLVEFESIEWKTTFSSRGTKTGERVLLKLQDEKIRFDTLDDIGMRPKMQEKVRQLLDLRKGYLLFSAMPGAGLKSSTNVLLRFPDRLVREFIAVEDEANRYDEIENVLVMTYNSADGQTPVNVLPKAFRMGPNVVVVRDMVNADTIGALCDEIAEERLIVSTVRAKDCAEALSRVMSMNPPKEFAQNVSGVLCQRLIRKLCDECKEAYAPPAKTLQQLRIPAGRVKAFFRPPQQPEKICKKCGGIGYYGQTAIFELLVVDESVRKALAGGAKHTALCQIAQKAGMRNFLAEGAILVAQGTTSVQELMRILKQ